MKPNRTVFTCFVAVFMLFGTGSFAQEVVAKKVKLPEELEEVSGLVARTADSLWWHNDSGGEPKLYLTNSSGDLLAKVDVPDAVNRDWEDLSTDSDGRFYVGDFGNNRRNREDLRIYRFAPGDAETNVIEFSYPGDQQHDVEAFFWYRDSLHLFTKSRIDRGCLTTFHYVIPATPGTHEAILRDSVEMKKRVVTAAAIELSTGRVVLLAYYYKRVLGFIPFSSASVFYLDEYPEGYFLRGQVRRKRISFLWSTQYESVDFLNAEQLLVASERTAFIAPKMKRIRW